MPKAAARHILVKTEAECQDLINQIKTQFGYHVLEVTMRTA